MKKILGLVLAIVFIISIVPVVGACHSKKPKGAVKISRVVQSSNAVILATMNDDMPQGNTLWVGTFQIVWNEVVDNLIHHPIEFVGGTTKTAQNLNKKEFTKNDIGKNSYYTKYGIVSPKLKKEIEKGIKDKFNETSDILDAFDFTYSPMKMFFYAMLKKDFKFLEPFDKLSENVFGNVNNEKVNYFGIDSRSEGKLYKNVSVLFYNSSNDYAVKLNTQTNDKVILYRTDDDKKFSEYFEDIKVKDKTYNERKYFGIYDRLKVPDISLYLTTNFPDVEGREIKNSNFKIDQTIETIDFKMNNEGVKLKSEAAIMMKATSAGGARPQIRYFYFDKKFILFLIEDGKDVPYYAMKVTDIAALNKTGRK